MTTTSRPGIHGPAVAVVYRKFKAYGFGPITESVPAEAVSEVPDQDLLEEVWEVYGKYDADYLE